MRQDLGSVSELKIRHPILSDRAAEAEKNNEFIYLGATHACSETLRKREKGNLA
jgi:hypothetical protein